MTLRSATDSVEINVGNAVAAIQPIEEQMHYLDGVNDMVRAWDETLAGVDGRTEAFEEFARLIDELRPQLAGLFPLHKH